jgi:hypothetical protein
MACWSNWDSETAPGLPRRTVHLSLELPPEPPNVFMCLQKLQQLVLVHW